MLRKWLPSLVLVAFGPLTVHAGGADKPAVVVRVRSLDALVENVKLVVTLAGREEIANQVEGLIKAKIGVDGLAGIDPARPFGAYARFGKDLDDIGGAVLVPIADEKAFLTLLDNLNLKTTKGKNDIYNVQAGLPVEIYLRFANRYAYVSALNPAMLEGKLVDPLQVLGKDGPSFSATVRLDQLPEAARQLAVPQIEQKLQALADQKVPGETPAQAALRIAAAKEFTRSVLGVINDGSEFHLAIDISAKTKEMSASMSLSGKSGSDLAKSIQQLGQGTSLFGTLKGNNVAFRGLTHAVLPAELKQGLGKLLDEGAAEALAKIQEPGKRQQAQQLLDVLMPSLKAGELDGFMQLRGPGETQKYTVVGGVKVRGGLKLGAKVEELVADAVKQMPEAARAMVKLNFATVGTVKIHRLDLPAGDATVREIQKHLGEVNLHVAFRDDAVFVAAGQDSLAALKEVVAGKNTGPSPVFVYEVDVARLAPIVAPTEELRASAKKIFQAGDDGMVRVSLEGGATLKLSISTRLPVIQFLSQTREAKAGN